MRSSSSAETHPRSRKRLFRIFAILVGVLPLLLIELSLRLAYPKSAEPIQDAVDNDPLVDLHQLRPLFEVDATGQRMSIPKERYNFFQPASFALQKTGKRLFVVGGSTVQGRPYATETSFAKFLELQLRVVDPDPPWEVINCGGVSYASYRVAAIVKEVLNYQPDGIIVYTGHNEFLEDRTYAPQRRVPRWAARLLASASHLRSVELASQWIHQDADPTSQPTQLAAEVQARLDKHNGLDAYHRDPAWHQQVVDHFELSLQRMIVACQAANVPLLFCVPASDVVKTPPFKVAFPGSLTEDQRSEQAALWKKACDTVRPIDQRLAACRSLLQLDPDHAGAAYMLGIDARSHGQADEAATWLLQARDHDVCPLRATSAMEQIVRQLVGVPNVSLLDTPELLAEPRTTRYADPKWFVDHVHPTVEGHQRIADELFRLLAALRWVEMDDDSLDSTKQDRDQAIIDHLGTLNESYFHRGRQRLKGLQQWAAGRALLD
ncbi:SGNH/GDSL hydrolase family protein [Novipirellula artificiosorum]|uniref:GDSL-like Lipase/Acylhydrolase n=1 Tax=Novipirellula artificiosorum TaxID=2528016 RepID=A0A5C6DNK3_9BACT|nr:hypothetical protein [Novipirellula artificiosorum]TWU37241.1 hypothetical protein Poly41_33700 [Novipirellula artificiosorum]